jgi:hypothetical protein
MDPKYEWRVVEVLDGLGERADAPSDEEPRLPTTILETDDPRWELYRMHITFDFFGTTVDLRIERQNTTRGPQPPVLTSRLLQSLSLPSIEQLGREAAAQRMRKFIQFNRGSAPLLVSEHLIGQMDTKRPSRRDPDRDLLLSRIAARYVETIGNRRQRGILSKEFRVKNDYVPDLVREARDRGLLTPTKRGRGGGSLTQRAMTLIWEDDNAKAAGTTPAKVGEITMKTRTKKGPR